MNSLLGIALPFWNFHFPTFLKSLSLYFVLKHLVRHPKFNKITLFIVKKFSPSVLIQIFLDLFKTIFVYYRRPIFRALCGYWVNIFILIFFLVSFQLWCSCLFVCLFQLLLTILILLALHRIGKCSWVNLRFLWRCHLLLHF